MLFERICFEPETQIRDVIKFYRIEPRTEKNRIRQKPRGKRKTVLLGDCDNMKILEISLKLYFKIPRRAFKSTLGRNHNKNYTVC